MLKEELTFYPCGRISRMSARSLASFGLKWCVGHKGIMPISEFYTPRKSSLCRKCDNRKVVNSEYHKKAGRLRRHTSEEVSRLKSGTGNGRFANSKGQAKFKGRTWTLSESEYAVLINKVCEYCQFPLNKWGYGLDRLDNNRGYELDNVVPCCKECNVARNSNFTPAEMRQFVGPAIKAAKLARANG